MATGFFKDRHGKTVITQPPNAPIIGWFVLVVVNYFVRSELIGWIATASLLVWAFMEIAWGADYFRRTLGLIVFIAVILAHVFD